MSTKQDLLCSTSVMNEMTIKTVWNHRALGHGTLHFFILADNAHLVGAAAGICGAGAWAAGRATLAVEAGRDAPAAVAAAAAGGGRTKNNVEAVEQATVP